MPGIFFMLPATTFYIFPKQLTCLRRFDPGAPQHPGWSPRPGRPANIGGALACKQWWCIADYPQVDWRKARILLSTFEGTASTSPSSYPSVCSLAVMPAVSSLWPYVAVESNWKFSSNSSKVRDPTSAGWTASAWFGVSTP